MTIFDQTLHPLPLALLRNLSGQGIKYATVTGTQAVGVYLELVAAVAGKKIRVLALSLMTSSAASTAYEVRSTNPGTVIGRIFANSTVPFVMAECAFGYFETVAGESLTIKDITGSTIYVNVTYAEVG